MSIRSMRATLFAVTMASGLVLSLGAGTTAAEQRQQLAMDDKMPMKSQRPASRESGATEGGTMSEHTRMLNDRTGVRGAMPGMFPGSDAVDLTDRIEGLLALFRVELHISDSQVGAWNTFAEALRSSHRHLIEARRYRTRSYLKSTERLQQYEEHLEARLNAVKSARAAYIQLYTSFDEAQKATADALVAPFIVAF